jgi:hypothetical protein
MDFSMISGAMTAITAARDIARTAVDIRDAAKLTAVTTALNEQLIKAQESLFQLSANLMALQQEHFKTTEELRKLNELLAERGRYSLVEIGNGMFAYRVNVAPKGSDMQNPGSLEPDHYVCQLCFNKGIKSVLQSQPNSWGGSSLNCFSCKQDFWV